MGQCTAKSKRSGKRCLNWAIRGKAKCRFHGGKSTGPRTKAGKERSRRAHIKHGLRTKDAMLEMRAVRQLIRDGKNLLNAVEEKFG